MHFSKGDPGRVVTRFKNLFERRGAGWVRDIKVVNNPDPYGTGYDPDSPVP